MKRYSLLCFIILLCVFNPKISIAEPGFFLQTLTSRFVDWVFGRIDTYIEDKPDQSEDKGKKESALGSIGLKPKLT